MIMKGQILLRPVLMRVETLLIMVEYLFKTLMLIIEMKTNNTKKQKKIYFYLKIMLVDLVHYILLEG